MLGAASWDELLTRRLPSSLAVLFRYRSSGRSSIDHAPSSSPSCSSNAGRPVSLLSAHWSRGPSVFGTRPSSQPYHVSVVAGSTQEDRGSGVPKHWLARAVP